MMIWKSMRREGDSQSIPDDRKYRCGLPMPATAWFFWPWKCSADELLIGVKQVVENISRQAHRILAGRGIVAIHHHRIHFLQARYRFAQRAGGEQQAVAKAARTIDDRDFDITLQAIMLQAIITQDDIALRVALAMPRAQ